MKIHKKAYTTEDIIKILFHKDVDMMNQTLEEYINADDATKYDKQEILWDEYRKFKDELTLSQYQIIVEEVQNGQKGFEKNMMDHAKWITYEYFDKILTGGIKDDTEIESIRHKLHALIQQSQPGQSIIEQTKQSSPQAPQ